MRNFSVSVVEFQYWDHDEDDDDDVGGDDDDDIKAVIWKYFAHN